MQFTIGYICKKKDQILRHKHLNCVLVFSKVQSSNSEVGGLKFVLKLRSVTDACNSCYDCKVLFQSLASDRRTTPSPDLFTFSRTT